MGANGSTHTTGEATVYVCDLDMFVQGQSLKESPATLSLGKLCHENGYSYERHPGQPSHLSKDGRNTECKAHNHILLVVPRVQATKHQTKALVGRKRTPAVGDHERSVETKLPAWLQPFREGLTRGSSRSTDVSTSNKSGRKHIFSIIFPKTRIAKYADARKLR